MRRAPERVGIPTRAVAAPRSTAFGPIAASVSGAAPPTDDDVQHAIKSAWHAVDAGGHFVGYLRSRPEAPRVVHGRTILPEATESVEIFQSPDQMYLWIQQVSRDPSTDFAAIFDRGTHRFPMPVQTWPSVPSRFASTW